MKIIFLIFLYSVARFSTQAQTSIYHEFPDSNAVWNIDESAYCFMLPFATLRYSIVLDGDTLIGEVIIINSIFLRRYYFSSLLYGLSSVCWFDT
ncbi:MAG: hypothetical protein IPF75_05095 [Bacteroidetes bacterium]|nr:hypothetical protein [Bacteroidota bacterium]